MSHKFRIFRAFLMLAASLAALQNCSAKTVDRTKREVSLTEYAHDLSCWSKVVGEKIDFKGYAIIGKITRDHLTMFPVSPYCSVKDKEDENYLFLDQVSFVDVIKDESFTSSFGQRKIVRNFGESPPFSASSEIYEVSATCSLRYPRNEPNSLELYRCKFRSIKRFGIMSTDFI